MNCLSSSCVVLGASLLLASVARSQTGHSIFVPSDSPASGACSVVPMGSSQTSGGAQLRSQMIQVAITAAELGNKPHRITNLAFAPCDSGVRYYGRLTISMAHKKAGPLSTTFADNILVNTKYPKTKVFDISRYDWPNRAGQWNNIGLTRSFDYDPTAGDLLIEIVARNADFTGKDPSMRSDSRPCVHASGFSPTPKVGVLATTSTKMRLSDGVGYIDSFMQPCGPGPLQLASTGKPVLGGHIDLQITGGTTSTQPTIGVLLLGFAPAHVGGLGSNCSILTTTDLIFWAPLTGGSSPSLRFAIPNLPGLVSGKLYFQGAHRDTSNTKLGFVFTGRTVVTIGR